MRMPVCRRYLTKLFIKWQEKKRQQLKPPVSMYNTNQLYQAEEQERRERHQKTMKEIYANMKGVTYKTTWAQVSKHIQSPK